MFHVRSFALSRTLQICAAGVSALMLVACGSSSSSHSASSHSSAAAAAQSSSAQKTTLTVWQYWTTVFPGLVPLQKKLDSEFEAQHPQYKVVDVPVSYADMPTKLSAAIAAGTGPNIVTQFPGVVATVYRNGLVPLNSYVTDADRQNWRLMNMSAGPGGTIYAVPWQEYGYFVYYNKALFKKAGLNPDSPPTSWQTFLSDAQALKAHGITAISGGFKDGYLWEWWAFPLLDQLMSPSATSAFAQYNYPMTSPPFQQVWADVKGLAPYFVANSAGVSLYPDAYNNFDAGKSAMLLDAPTLSNLTTAQKDLGTHNVGVFPVPRLPGSLYGPFVDVGPEGGWSITKWTPNKTAAWAYITWMESKEAGDQMWDAGLIPNNAQSAKPTNNAAIKTILTELDNPLNHSVYLGFPISVLAINEKYAGEMISGQTSTTNVLHMMEQLREELRPKVVGVG